MEPWPTALVLYIIPPTASGMNGAARRQPLFMDSASGGAVNVEAVHIFNNGFVLEEVT